MPDSEEILSLGKLGFEYGDCQTQQVIGDVEWLEIQYTQINGVQKVSFSDQVNEWSFGYEIAGQAKVIERQEFNDTKKWVGLHGVESAEGIERLGIITMDPTCVPLNGTIKETQVQEAIEEKKTVETEVLTVIPQEVETDTSTEVGLMVVIGLSLTVVLITSIVAVICLKRRCQKKEMKL